MTRCFAVGAILFAAIAVAAIRPEDAEGCATVRKKDGASIRTAEESAIIAWDPQKKVEHFIRRAAFVTTSADFGFLVPTPTLPELPLQEVRDDAFRAMNQWIQPRVVERTRLNFEPMLCLFSCSARSRFDTTPAAARDGVRLLHQQTVGGFDVSVLEADDAEALARWINERGYSADPELYSWLMPYVAAKWKISAFKIAQDPKTGGLATTRAVRMSFKTDRPFFPYREPEEKKDPKKDESRDEKEDDARARGGRLLRVHFVGDARMEGTLGARTWEAETTFSDKLAAEQRRQVAEETGLTEADLPATAWLTTFEDRSARRPGNDEAYFQPAADRSPIRPPDIIRYQDWRLPLDCVAFSLIACIAFLYVAAKAIPRGRTKKTPVA